MRQFPRIFVLPLLITAIPVFADQPQSGTYELTMSPNLTFESVICLLRLDVKDATVIAKVLAGSGSPVFLPEVKSTKLDGDILRIVLTVPGPKQSRDMQFEGKVSKPGERILGSYGLDSSVRPPPYWAWLIPTTKTTIDLKERTRQFDVPDPYRKAAELMTNAAMLKSRASKAKEADQQAKLQKEADDARREMMTQLLGLYRQTVEKHPNTYAAIHAADLLVSGAFEGGEGGKPSRLIPSAAEREEPPDQVSRWAEIVVSDAAQRGPSFEMEWNTRMLRALGNHKPYAAIAVKYGTQAEKMLGPNATAEQQLRVLTPLATALRNDGKEVEADAMDKRVADLKKQIEK